MKKSLIYIYSIILFIAISMSACSDDFLQEDIPDGLEVPIGTRLGSTYTGLINSAYNRLLSPAYVFQQGMLTPDALADNMVIVNQTGRYQNEVVNAVGAHLSYWFLYPAINDCNIVIDSVAAVPLTGTNSLTLEQKAMLLAQAHSIRALVYFDMLRVHAYDPTQIVNNWDRGVILRTSGVFDISQADFRNRSTIEQGYTLIENDLRTAIDYFDAYPTAATALGVTRLNKGIAYGLLARLYLHWGRYQDALDAVDDAFDNSPATIVTAANYAASFRATPNPESLFELSIIRANTSAVYEFNDALASITTNDGPGYQFVAAASPSLMAEFEPADVRRNLWQPEIVQGVTFQECRKWTGAKGDGLDNVPIMRASELILIAAEAQHKLGNFPEARAELNFLRSRRGFATTLPTTLEGTALLNFILKERRVEFCFEGHRFFDLKRNGLPIAKDDGTSVPYADFRILAPIPFNQTILNSNLEQNPGY